MSWGKLHSQLVICLSMVLGCLVQPGFAQTFDIETDADVLTVQQRSGAREMGCYVSENVYKANIDESDWEAVVGLYNQCLAYRFHQKFDRQAESDDVFSQIRLVHDAMQRVPDKFTGRKAAYNNNWYWKGLFVPSFGLKHRDSIALEAGDAQSLIRDGITTSLIEYTFDVLIQWDSLARVLTITAAPRNVTGAGLVELEETDWLSFNKMPLNLRLFSINRNIDVSESITGGIGNWSINGGYKYNYTISRDRWSSEVQLGPCVQGDIGKVSLEKLILADEIWYELHIFSGLNPYVQSYAEESLATVTEQVCSTERSLTATVEVEVKEKSGELKFESETKSKCVGTGSTLAASVYADISTNIGDGLVADHVMATRVFGSNRAVSFSRPEFATDIYYACNAAVSGIDAPPIAVTSNGGQPKLPVKKIYKRDF